MKLDSVRVPAVHSVWLNSLSAGPSVQQGFVDIRFGLEAGEYTLSQHQNLLTVSLREPRRGPVLDALLGSGRARLATVDQVSPDGGAVLVTIRFFNGSVVEIGPIDVGVDDGVRKSADLRLRTRRLSMPEFATVLQELCALELGPTNEEHYFLLNSGAAASEDFDAAIPPADADSAAPEPSVEEGERAFCIHGDGVRIAVIKKRVSRDEEKFLATHLTSSLGAAPDGSVRLARGRLTFSEFNEVDRVRALAAGAMTQLMEKDNGYLKKWDEYGAIEGELLLDRARSVGMLSWTGVEQVANGVQFFFEKPLGPAISDGDELEFVAKVPEYLQRPDTTWAQYEAQLVSESAARSEVRNLIGQGRPQVGEGDTVGTVAKVLVVTERSLVLDLHAQPDKADLFLILSMSGDRRQIERRMEARQRILTGRSANPMLGLVIEEGGEPPLIERPSKIKPLSAFVVEKIFSKPPTATQVEAIRIALNTPDIALIQGPPGTGKTTVIAAIVERLNELSDKGQPIQGEVLITAYQHDAIENMMAKMTVNAIPVPKFGKRSGSSAISDHNEERSRIWCGSIAAQVRAKNPNLKVSERLRDVQMRCQEYVLSPSLDNAIGTIDAFLHLPEGQLSKQLDAQAKELKRQLERERDGRLGHREEDEEVLHAIWSLRASLQGFLDDGPAMAQVVLDLCGADLPPSTRGLLARAAAWRPTEPVPSIEDLRSVKGDLLDWYRPRAAFRVDKPRSEVLRFVHGAEQQLTRGAASSIDRTDSILAEFLQELESNPSAAQRAVEDYGFVFAATCQQSQGREITKRKSRDMPREIAPEYDTVIVDEAARCSPRDLLIPMSQARTRIILVGDHRQLPHMIDEEIAKSLEERGDVGGERAADREESFIRRSMFQYLLSRLKKLAERDGIQRWVTLDQQFRMHPQLGDFVSDNFYRVHGPAEAFTSPLPAQAFVHNLPGIENVPAIWLDVPAQQGREEHAGTSYVRKVEARQIAKWIDRWIDSPTGCRLTYGVISFYEKQGAEVYQALSKTGRAARGPDDKWQTVRQQSAGSADSAGSTEERLRIGTVDSFQGLEFDIVFLSMVRTSGKLPAGPSADSSERALQERRAYGRLTSPNLLCVGMSRQKRLLVVVGDKAMVEHELAKDAIPGLVGFLNLCKTRGIVLHSGA